MTTLNRVASAALVTGIFLVAISGCEKGPAESAGKVIDDSVEKVGQSLENASDRIEDASRDVDN